MTTTAPPTLKEKFTPATSPVQVLKGMIKKPVKPVSIEEMNRTIAEQGAIGTPCQNRTSAVKQMHAFMQSHLPILGIDTKALIEEGRD